MNVKWFVICQETDYLYVLYSNIYHRDTSTYPVIFK